MKFVMEREGLVDEMCKENVGRQQLCDVELHLVCHQNHQTAHEFRLTHRHANNAEHRLKIWAHVLPIISLGVMTLNTWLTVGHILPNRSGIL